MDMTDGEDFTYTLVYHVSSNGVENVTFVGDTCPSTASPSATAQ